MKKKSFSRFSKKHSGSSGDVELPLAPMASVFTVILVYLIKSATLSVSSMAPSTELILPEVSTVGEIPDALKVEISGSAILVADKPVMELENFKLKNREPASSGSDAASLFLPLQKALEFEKGEGKDAKEAKLVVIADKNAPYEILKKVMASAANVGFMDLKLVVVGGE